MTKLNRTQKSLLLGSLVALVLVMGIAYATFFTQLNIIGTSSITSSWNIKITGIEVENAVQAENVSKTFDNLSAKFTCNLTIPGTSKIDYVVTIKNDGNLDAVLNEINIDAGNNPAIAFSTDKSQLKKDGTNNVLPAGESKTVTITVIFNDITSMPESTTSKITASFDFVQYTEGTAYPSDSYSGIVYRNTTDILSVGDPIEGIETTTDYTTLNKTYFLKHYVTNNKITSSEACFIYNGLHCLIAGDGGAAYENNKTVILNALGSEHSSGNGTYLSSHNANSLFASVNDTGHVFAGVGLNDAVNTCHVWQDTHSSCN